ncbi:diguanylate cyclase [Sporosarcina sp. BI001-red]|nr:diguanylate cyclase [Sporosarcina sp. BI001-red]
MLIIIDCFKDINDTFGHMTGTGYGRRTGRGD